jgi:outer membrane biosynthesis protein TonB
VSEVARAPASVGVIGTTLAHALFLAGLLLAVHRSSGPETISYAVNLVAAPAPSDASARTTTVAPPKREPEKTVAAKPTVKPKKPTPKTTTKPAAAKPAAKTTPLPGETPGTGEDVLTRSFPGLNFPYPEYLRNIVNQIYSRFAQQTWPPGLEATVGFTIHRDGSVTDIIMLKQAGYYSFNLAAKSAVIAAANANVFGPLPSGWPDDKLEISFSFSPRKP